MLKRLELVGFKSFADKTVFDFNEGITAIVGPNGSGKSNIVDAVRWILGEQSAKSLRGGEMADVIFNGSTSRRGLGLAEVTMTFDNRRRQLATDHEEVQITRRVHRTGEGEYLINGQLGRLKDIKELFLGSGAGTDAYCIIEQGKVDVLLQASTKDRRTIFEEAAGISRFKARKIETLRKLERVDQNLSRVRDIIDEVDKQLRSVKLQASKAERYREYSQRLRFLRLTLGRREFGELDAALAEETQTLEAMRLELDQRAARAGACETEAERLEIDLADLEDALRDRETDLARVGEHIQSQQAVWAHEAETVAEVEGDLARTRRRWSDLTGHISLLAGQVLQAEKEAAVAEEQAQGQRRETSESTEALASLQRRLGELQESIVADKAGHLEQMRRAAHLQNEAVAARAHLDNLLRESRRLQQRSAQAAEHLAVIDVELQELVEADEGLQARLQAARSDLAQRRREREEHHQRREEIGRTIGQQRERRSGLASRLEVLDGLLKSHEGLGAAVREVYALLEEDPEGPWGTVLGLLADFLTVKREHAGLIDLAVADWSSRFLVRDAALLEQALAAREVPFGGRVGFFPIVPREEPDAAGSVGLPKPGVPLEVEIVSLQRLLHLPPPAADGPIPIARADTAVSCEHPDLAGTDTIARILGRTLLVHDSASARRIAPAFPGHRLLTLAGELLEPDGTLIVGPPQAETGLLTRRSERQELAEQTQALDLEIARLEEEHRDLGAAVERLDKAAADQQEEIDVLAEQAADFRTRLERHRERRQDLHEEVSLQQGELDQLARECAEFENRHQEAQAQAAAAEQQVQFLQDRLRAAEEEVRVLENDRRTRQEACTQSQVLLAQVEERLRALSTKHRQLAGDLRQRSQELAAAVQNLEEGRRRLRQSHLLMLEASQNLAHDYLDKESFQIQVADMLVRRERKRQERARLVQQAQAARQDWRQQQEDFHQRELAAADLRHRRDTLVQRLREDYQIDLTDPGEEAAAEPTPMPEGATEDPEGATEDATEDGAAPEGILDPAAAQQEIEELRRKLSRLGSVNLDALAELEDLEQRARDLQTQYDDLASAKKSLEEIIDKINLDSRRLFQETFDTIRAHFQELFRKLFGGGMADIVLENEADILECGVEIVARPPGKELRSISLMSGGEKTMTAVALLLAIFRSRPSPFCLLDEVDAALDEANIGRFTGVLREFLEYSQFIIVTHSKKTMAIADALYGITMQESGISKQVAIRFQDWVDEETPPGGRAAG